MASKTSLSEIKERELEGVEPLLQAVGYELQPDQMRLNVWAYEPGETNHPHRHEEQEELYVPLEGTVAVTVDETEHVLSEGDFLMVPSSARRQVEARDHAQLLVVGAPNAADDAILE